MTTVNFKVLRNGVQVGESELKEGDALQVGRIGCGNDVELDDNQVSRNHACIAVQSGQLTITDLGSTNSTLINGNPIPANHPQVVNDGDIVKFSTTGKFEMSFMVDESQEIFKGQDDLPETKRGMPFQGQEDNQGRPAAPEDADAPLPPTKGKSSPAGVPRMPNIQAPRIQGVGQLRTPRIPDPRIPNINIQAPRIPGVGRPVMPRVNAPRTLGGLINAAGKFGAGSQKAEENQDNAAEGNVQLAGFWLRFLAAMLDGLIFWLASYSIMVIVILVSIKPYWITNTTPSPWLLILWGLLFFILLFITPWIYYAFFESSSRQATPGKMILGLMVMDMNGEKISFWRATGRHFSKILSSFLAIGYIMAGFTAYKQGLHDIIAKTFVVKK